MELLIRITIIAGIAVLAFAASSKAPADQAVSPSIPAIEKTTVQKGRESGVDRGIAHATDSVGGSKQTIAISHAEQTSAAASRKAPKGGHEMPVQAAAVTFLSLIALVAIARRGISAVPDAAGEKSGKNSPEHALERLISQSSGKGVKHAENSTR